MSAQYYAEYGITCKNDWSIDKTIILILVVTCCFKTREFMHITHTSHIKMVGKKSVHKTYLQHYTKKSQYHAWIYDLLKSALSVDDTPNQKCFEWVKWVITVTRVPFFRCRKYQSGDKSCRCAAAIHGCIALIAAILSSRLDLNWDFFLAN